MYSLPDALIEEIYSTPTDPSRWNRVLQKLCALLQLSGITLSYFDSQRPTGGVALFEGLDPDGIAKYPEFVQHDFMVDTCRLVAPGTYLNSAAMKSKNSFERTVFYNDFLRHFGYYHIAGGFVTRGPGVQFAIAMHRPQDFPFEREEERAYRAFQPHIRRALELQVRLQEAAEHGQMFEDALDRLESAIVVLDLSGSVLLANRRARELSARDDGFQLGPDGLCGATATISSRIGDAIRQAAAATSEAPPRVVELPRVGAGGSYRLVVARITRPNAGLDSNLREFFLAFVSEPDRPRVVPPALLAEIFGLTPSESRVSGELLLGQSPAEIGETLGTSTATVRVHLKAIFAKTGTNSQAQAVARMLSAIPPWS